MKSTEGANRRDREQRGAISQPKHLETMMHDNPDERVQTEPIASERIAHEHKIFFLDLKENKRGRFLKITEDVRGRRNTIMLPASAFKDFGEAFERLVAFESKL